MDGIGLSTWQFLLSMLAAFGGFFAFLFFEHSRLMSSIEAKHRDLMDRIDHKLVEHVKTDHTPRGYCEGKFFPEKRGENLENDMKKLQGFVGFLRAKIFMQKEHNSYSERSRNNR